MQILFEPLAACEPVKRLLSSLAPGRPIVANNVPDGLKAPLAALLAKGKPVLLVTYNDMQATRLYEDAISLLGQQVVAMLPAREMALYRFAAESRELSARRLDAMHRVLSGGAKLVVASVDALLPPMMPPELFQSATATVREGMTISREDLIVQLHKAGYERVDLVEGRGQFAARGGILDVYPAGYPTAVRIEFYDIEIDTIRLLDVLSQRSESRVEELHIPPASEVILDGEAPEAARRIREELDSLMRSFEENEAGSGENSGKVSEGELTLRDEEKEPGGLEIAEDYSLFFGDDVMPSLFDDADGSGEDGAEEKPKPFAESRARLKTSPGGRLLDYAERLEAGERFEGIESLLPYLYENPAYFMDYLPESAVVFFDEPNHMRERCQNIELEFAEHLQSAMERGDALKGQAALMREYGELLARLFRYPCAALCRLHVSMPDMPLKDAVDFQARSGGTFHGQIEMLASEIKEQKAKKRHILLMAGGTARGQRLMDNLRQKEIEASFRGSVEETSLPGEAVILAPTISHGFIIGGKGGLCVISDSEIYGAARRPVGRSRKTAGQRIAAFTDLNPGDYVVHESHGVAIYEGTVRIEVDGRSRDYLYLRYHGEDKLYVPTDQMDRVQKFIGSDDHAPKINKLGGGEWNRLKQRVRASIEDMAEDLVKLYAQRQTEPGFAYSADTPWQREFEDSFPYEETTDQLQCIEEIKRDMELPRAMDRLLCGDVGYGKTEVAVRAAFKAVMDSRQVAVLVPTTVLAQQHHQTFVKRFKGFPVRIEMLSRFRSPAEQADICRRLHAGELDIVVGTHRILGKDVRFKNLGLLIVDEEQRFGVAHKERIKQMRQNIDVLTLSATPIPRTLHMSMVGIRDMSLIETPPEERYPVQTYVIDYNDSLVRDAILRELARGGQAYIVYNRVRSIDLFHEHLRNVVPEARIVVGHGQMRENALEDVMSDFYEGKYDVLLCSTIIESGLDVPNCNTMIVCEADRFGLSQLYQLRGRVGRSNRLAYCYLTIKPDKSLNEIAEKRLSAIREFTEFGSGFKIAMRDLEIRGAGNILGAEQHGHMSAVGYDMYVKLMEEAINKLRGDHGLENDIETRIELRIDAYLPETYVRGNGVRLEVYKRIASIDGKQDRDDCIEELIDRFGDVPDPVAQLVSVSYLKSLCAKLQIEQVSTRGGSLHLRFAEGAQLDPFALLDALKDQKDLILSTAAPTALLYKGRGEPEKLIREVSVLLEKLMERMGMGA